MAITNNGTGSITGLTAGGLPDGSVTNADLEYAGTSGQVLTSQGSGSAPQWANAAGWTEVTATSTSGTDLEFTSLPSDWSELLIIWQGVTGSTSHELEFQFGTSA